MKKQAKNEQDAKRKSSLITLLIAGITVSLLFLSLRQPYPPMDEAEGMMIDFGYDLTGTGNIETSSTDVNAAPPVQTNPKSVDDEMLTQDEEKTITLPEKNKIDKPKNTDNEVKNNSENTKPEDKIDPNQTFGKDKKWETNSNSDGNTGGDGNFGNPDGVKDGGKGGEGNNPNSSGIGSDLTGRTLLKKSLSSNSLESGKIVFKISVDKNGYIRSATYERSGSTIVDASVINYIKGQLINKQWYQTKSDAPESQEGRLTVNISMN